MLGKLLFKVSVPLMALTGVLSYGYYLQGGDPKALLGRVAGGISGQFSEQMAGAGESARSALDSAGALGRGGDAAAHETRVHRWVDADGVTHYSTEAPEPGQQATIVTVSSRTNVIAAMPARASVAPEPVNKARAEGLTGAAAVEQDIATGSPGQQSLAASLDRLSKSLPGGTLPGGIDAATLFHQLDGDGTRR